MGDFSLFVRQELPNAIRPQKPQPAARTPIETTDFTGLGFAVLAGGSGTVVDLNYSYSASFSRSMEQEKERISDTVRVKQKTKDPATGKEEVNEENYIDVNVPKQILTVNDADGTEKLYKYIEPYVLDVPANIEIIEKDFKDLNPGYKFYAPMKPNEPPPTWPPAEPSLAANRGMMRRRRR